MGHEDRTTSTISFNASTRTFTIAPVNTSFTVWCKGKKVVVSSAQTVTIPNTSGMHSIYYDANGTLSSKLGYFTFSEEAPTAYVYWNATTGAAPYFGDERHGVVLDWQTHEYLHRTRGAAIANGFLASGYTLNNSATDAATQIAIESGTFFDEDMKIDIVSTATPTAGTYEQNLLFPAKIPVLHLQGTSWVMDAPTNFPFKQGTSRPQYNSLSGGVWSTADVGNNQHATTWILATNNLTYPVIAIIGQSATDNLGEAEAFSFADLTLTGFPSVEFRPLYKLIYKASDGYANSVNAQLVSIVDLRSISAAGSAANPATDHGNLSGLTDDDHPQYLSVDTVRGTLTAAVKASFLPSQAGNAGKFLTTDATSTSWAALTSGNITTALGFTPYNATNPAGYITGITSSDVTTALGFTPYNATNPSGFVTAAGARGAISVTGAGSYDSATGVINIVGGVTSFNTRTGAITLSSADVTTALGFTPYNSTNPNGYLTGITSTQVTTALGYTPYNSSNPSGYITGITSGMVTTALGFTPYNNSNPSGYITSSALSGYLTSASAASTYLPLAGGTLTGITLVKRNLGTNDYTNVGQHNLHLRLQRSSDLKTLELGVLDNGTGVIQANEAGVGYQTLALNPTAGSVTANGSIVLHAGNYNSYALPLSGGTLTGKLKISLAGGTLPANFFEINNTVAGAGNRAGMQLNTGSSWSTTIFTEQGNWWHAFGSDVGEVRWGYDGTNLKVGSSIVLHAGNYNSYSPTLTGGGASGTWGINVTGYSRQLNGYSNQTEHTILDGPANGPVIKVRYDSATANRWIDIGYKDGNGVYSEGLKVYNGDTLTMNGSTVLRASNYGSYALPLSGGTMTGLITGGLSAGSYGINMAANDNYVAMRVISNNNTSGTFSDGMYIGYQNGNSGVTRIFGGGASSGGIIVNGSGVNNVTIAGNIALNAGNYTSYSPTLTGGGASGTWGINITGNAATATTAANYLPLSGGTLTGSLTISAGSSTQLTVRGTEADIWLNSTGPDATWRILGSTGSNTHRFRIYDHTNSAERFFITGNGNVSAQIDMRAPIFYDSDDTSRYVNPNGTTNIGAWTSNSTANIQTGSGGSVYQQIENTDAAGVYAYLRLTASGAGNGYLIKNRTTGNSVTNQSLYLWNDPGPIEFVPNGNAALRTTLSTGGILTVATDVRAPIFYDSNNTAFYTDPAGTSNMDTVTAVNFRMGNALYLGGNNNYINNNSTWFGTNSSFRSDTDIRATIFYDSNNTNFYLNPEAVSSLYGVAIRGDQSPTDSINQIFFWGAGDTTTSAIGFKNNGGEFPNPTGSGDGYNTYFTMDTPGRGWVFREGVGGSNFNAAVTSGWILNNGIWQANASMRAPIFYDSNDTGRYVDPNGTTNIGALNTTGLTLLGGQLYVSGVNPNTLNSGFNNAADGSDIWLNYRGYNDAQAYFRNFNVGDGKGTNVLWASGPNKRLSINNGQVADYTLHVQGIGYASNDFRAPIFYDSNDTGYYYDGSGLTNINRFQTNQSTATINLANAAIRIENPSTQSSIYFSFSGTARASLRVDSGGSYVMNSDNNDFYFNNDFGGSTQRLYSVGTQFASITGNYLTGTGSLRAPIFYDSDNTGYYFDGASTSTLNNVSIASNVGIGVAPGSTSNGARMELRGTGVWDAAFNFTNTGAGGQTWTLFSTNNSFGQGGNRFLLYNTTAGSNGFAVDSSNNLTVGGNVTAYGTVSDRRLKHNIREIPTAIAKVLALKPVYYTWNEDTDQHRIAGMTDDLGFIAQDAEEVEPLLVRAGADGMLGLRERGIIALLTKSFQEQNQEVVDLRNRVAHLESLINKLIGD
jgi:hypothetical protein